MDIKTFTPSVDKRILVLLAGLMWCGAGIILWNRVFRSLFSFMTWKSYIIVVIMVSMGIALRHSFIPRRYLSVLYNGIGLALFLSGIRYLRFFLKLLFTRSSQI